MSGPVNRDSQSRCSAPSHLYDAIRQPLRPPMIPKPSLDRIETPTESVSKESAQQRLNRQMLERLRKMGFDLPQDSVVSVVQVGKYVVLAILLPPYMLVYGIPRWLLLSAFPEIFGFIKVPFILIGAFMQKWSHKIIDLMQGVLEQTLGQALNLMNQYKRNVLNFFTEALAKTMNGAKKLIDLGTHALMSPFRAFEKYATGTFKVLQNWMKGIENRVETLFDRMTNRSVRAAEWCANRFDRMSQGYQAFLKRVSEVSDQTLHFYQKINNAVFALGNRAVAKIVDFSKNLVEKLQFSDQMEWMEKIQNIRKKIKEKVQEAEKSFSNAYERVAEKLEKRVNQLCNAIANVVHAIPQALVQAAFWMYQLIPERSRDQIVKVGRSMQRFGSRMKQLYRGVKNGIVSGGSYVFEAYRIIKSEISKWFTFLKRMAKKLFMLVLALPRKIFERFRNLAPMVIKSLKLFVYALRMFCSLIWALSVWGCSSTWEMLNQYKIKV